MKIAGDGQGRQAASEAGGARVANQPSAGLAGWLLARLGGRGHRPPRLALLERIALAPRQSLALVEAEGRRFLVATSADGAPAFYPLDSRDAGPARNTPARPASARNGAGPAARVSW